MSASALTKVIKAEEEYRNFGNKDKPVSLLWITVAFILYRVIPFDSQRYKDWLHQEIPTYLASDKGIAWIERILPSILEALEGFCLISEVTTEPNLPVTRVEKDAKTEPLPAVSQSREEETLRNTDELPTPEEFRAKLENETRKNGLLPIEEGQKYMRAVMDFTKRALVMIGDRVLFLLFFYNNV